MTFYPKNTPEYRIYKAIFQTYIDIATQSKFDLPSNIVWISKYRNPEYGNQKWKGDKNRDLEYRIDSLKREGIVLDSWITKRGGREMYSLKINPEAKIKFYLTFAKLFDFSIEEQYSQEKQRDIVLRAIKRSYKKFAKKNFYVHFCASPTLERDEDFERSDEKSTKVQPPIKSDFKPRDAIYVNFIKILCGLDQEGLISLDFIDSWRAFGSRHKVLAHDLKKKIRTHQEDYSLTHIDYSAFITLQKKFFTETGFEIPGKEESNKIEAPYFDIDTNKLIYGDKICKIRPDTKQYYICRAILKKGLPTNKECDLLDICDEMEGTDVTGRGDVNVKNLWRPIYDSIRAINKKAEEKLGIIKLLEFKNKVIRRLL